MVKMSIKVMDADSMETKTYRTFSTNNWKEGSAFSVGVRSKGYRAGFYCYMLNMLG